MKYCSKCLLPESHETISFDANGVCSVCLNIMQKGSIDWDSKRVELDEIVRKVRGKGDYDCIVPFSGGKDSVWTLYYAVKILGLKPLVVSFDHGFYRPNLVKNREKVTKQLGVDVLIFTPNWRLVQKLMLQSFLEKGDFCWHCHTGIFSYPMWIALEKKIPLILWGEPSSEYTSYYDYSETEHVDEERFNRMTNLGMTAQDMQARLGGEFLARDFKPFTYPSPKDLKELGVISVPLGSFIPWDVKKQVGIISEELGWQGDQVEGIPSQYPYEKIECYLQGVRDYIKYRKRGFARTTHLTSIDIRNNRMSRTEALKLVAEHEGKRPQSLDLFLSYVGLTEEEFDEVVESHRLAWVETPRTFQLSTRLHDSDEWNKNPSMQRDQSLPTIEEWREFNQ
jgi:N-acetyl sugar amidotransferase